MIRRGSEAIGEGTEACCSHPAGAVLERRACNPGCQKVGGRVSVQVCRIAMNGRARARARAGLRVYRRQARAGAAKTQGGEPGHGTLGAAERWHTCGWEESAAEPAIPRQCFGKKVRQQHACQGVVRRPAACMSAAGALIKHRSRAGTGYRAQGGRSMKIQVGRASLGERRGRQLGGHPATPKRHQ